MTEPMGAVVCLECGGRNRPGDDFCGDCGAYLAWDESPSASADAASSATARDETAFHETDLSSASAPERRDQDAAAAAAGESGFQRSEADDAGAAAGAVTAAPAGAEAPRAVPGPSGAKASPTAESPALRKPGAAAAPRSRSSAAPVPQERPPAPGDLICPACGAGNRPDRRFCRRCAARLVAPAAAAASTQPAAGARPKTRSVRFPFTAVVVLAMMVALIVIAWLNRDVVIEFVQTIVGFVFSSQSP
jgi:hypothetical protein